MTKFLIGLFALSLLALVGCAPKEEAATPPAVSNNPQQVVPGQPVAGGGGAGAVDVKPPMKPGR
jgi:hypothetical protein